MPETGSDQQVQLVIEGLSRVFGDASPSSVFSAPTKAGDALVITAAASERAGGFGFGAGRGADQASGDGEGVGGGGGGTAQVRPVAVITVRPDGIEVRPVIDFTKIGVTALLAGVGIWRILRR